VRDISGSPELSGSEAALAQMAEITGRYWESLGGQVTDIGIALGDTLRKAYAEVVIQSPNGPRIEFQLRIMSGEFHTGTFRAIR
jgi:hypothetical protein